MGERKSAMEGLGGLMLNIKRKPGKKLWEEVWIIATVVFAFMTAACINKWQMMGSHMAAYLITLFADLILVGGWSWKICNGILKWGRSGSWEMWADKAGAGIVMLYCTAVRIVQLKDMPYWDGLVYYNMLRNACDKFDFTFSSFWDNFIFAAHPTLAFAGITAIGEFLKPNEYVGVLVVWLIVTLLAAYCAYRIFRKLMPKSGFWYPILAACVLMTTPSVLGTFSYYQPDMGLVCFFLFLLYAYLYEKNILMFFSMFLLLMTKEIGILAVGGFGVGILIGRIIFRKKEESIKESLIRFAKSPLGICMMLVAGGMVLYVASLLISGGSIWSYKDSGFRIEPKFIMHKCKQYCVMNFNWIVIGGNAFFLLLRKKHPMKFRKIVHREVLMAVLCAWIAQMIFLCLYVTFALPRYHLLIDMCGVFLLLVQLGEWQPSREKTAGDCRNQWKKVISFGIGGLFLLEAYVTIDPISILMFEHSNTGKNNIITENYDGGPAQMDYIVYNHHYSYLTGVYNHILSAVNYHEGMDVIFWSQQRNYGILESGYYWDPEAGKLTLDPQNSIPIRGYIQEERSKEPTVMQQQAVFIGIPQFWISMESAEEFLNQYYEIRYQGTMTVGQLGDAFFYVCDLIR